MLCRTEKGLEAIVLVNESDLSDASGELPTENESSSGPPLSPVCALPSASITPSKPSLAGLSSALVSMDTSFLELRSV